MTASNGLPAYLDVSTAELARTYHYDSGQKFTIEAPARVYVLDNGSHRVIDKGGITYRPTPGWLAISWVPKFADKPFIA